MGNNKLLFDEYAIAAMQAAIVTAATEFEARVVQAVQSFADNVAAHGYPATEREVVQEMFVGDAE